VKLGAGNVRMLSELFPTFDCWFHLSRPFVFG